MTVRFGVWAAIDTDIVPALCNWYHGVDSEEREVFRERIGTVLCKDIQHGMRWHKKPLEWLLPLLKQIAKEDESPNWRDTLQMLSRAWRYAERMRIDPHPYFQTLAEALDPQQERIGMLVSQMLQSQ